MARTTLKADRAAGERGRWPLSERIVDENLGGYHRVPLPRVRMGRAAMAADHAAASRAARAAEHSARVAEHAGESHEGGEQELVDVKWLFAWADEARRERRLNKRQQPYRGAIRRLRTRRG